MVLQRTRSTDDYHRLRTIFVDRGLFLLTVGHLLLLGSHAPAYTVRFFCITDTIAACLLVSPLLAERCSALNRIGIGVAAYFVSAIALESWPAHSEISAILKETFVGSLSPVVYNYSFPILPWFAVNCFGSALGEMIGRYELSGDRRRMQRLLASSAVVAMTAAMALSGLYVTLKLVTSASVIAAAFEWQRRAFNRFLTVGYKRLREPTQIVRLRNAPVRPH